MRTMLGAITMGVVLVAGCGRTSATPRPATTPAPTRDPGYITKAELGKAWPFTIDAGTLKCYADDLEGHQYVTFDDGDGIEYALNGSARDFGFPELDKST